MAWETRVRKTWRGKPRKYKLTHFKAFDFLEGRQELSHCFFFDSPPDPSHLTPYDVSLSL